MQVSNKLRPEAGLLSPCSAASEVLSVHLAGKGGRDDSPQQCEHDFHKYAS